MKLSNSCTLWKQRGRRVLLRLWQILRQPSPWRGPSLPFSLLWWQNSGTESVHTSSLTNSHHLLWPAPLRAEVGSCSDCPCKNLGPSRLRPKPEGLAEGKKEGGMERARFFWTLFSLGWKVLWNKQCGCCMVSSKPSGHLLKKARSTNAGDLEGKEVRFQTGNWGRHGR